MSSTDFIKLPLKILVTMGLKMPNSSNSSDRYKFQATWLFPFVAVNLLYGTIGQFFGLSIKIQNREGLASLGQCIFALIFCSSAITKIFLILFERQCFNDSLIELDDILPKTTEDQNSYKLKKYLNDFTVLMLSITFVLLLMAQYTGWSTSVIDYFDTKGTNETFVFALPYGDNYPFYSYSPVMFVIFLLLQCWEAYICSGLIFVVNFLICGLMWQVHMHYEHLHKKLASFNETETSETEHLTWCISKQIQLEAIFKRLNDSCSFVTLFEIFFGCMELVFACFLAIVLTRLNDYIKNIFAAIYACTELYLVCFYSQKITDISERVKTSIYESNWTNKSMKYKKAMILMIQQNQRMITFKAYKFADLSMELFSIIMRFAYKLITLLSNTS